MCSVGLERGNREDPIVYFQLSKRFGIVNFLPHLFFFNLKCIFYISMSTHTADGGDLDVVSSPLIPCGSLGQNSHCLAW